MNAEIYIHSDHGEYPSKRQLADDPRKFRILRLFLIRVNGKIIVALPGLVIDFFSVPRLLWWLQPPATGAGTPAALGHDIEYALNWDNARRQADLDFCTVLEMYGTGVVTRALLYIGVRSPGGWLAWHRKTGDQIEYAKHFSAIVPENDTDRIKALIRRGMVMENILNAEYSYSDSMEERLISVGHGDIDSELAELKDVETERAV